jgi:mono/diheme cytochrome c family protein
VRTLRRWSSFRCEPSWKASQAVACAPEAPGRGAGRSTLVLRPARSLERLFAVAILALLAVGCRQDMHDGPKYEPLEASALFPDGKSARDPVPGTVARGQLVEDAAFTTGLDAAGKPLTEVPVKVDLALLERGRERFDIYCSPCHGRLGNGRGMIVRRGYKQPRSFHLERLRTAPVGYFFDVATNGFGQMPSYSFLVPPADRWAIAAYIRALQFSQSAHLADLPDADRQALAQLPAAAAGEAAAAGGVAAKGEAPPEGGGETPEH